MLVKGPARYMASFRVAAQGVNPSASKHMNALKSFLRKSKIKVEHIPGMGTSNYHGPGVSCHDYMCELSSFANWPFVHTITNQPQIISYSYYKKLYSICLLQTTITQDVNRLYSSGGMI